MAHWQGERARVRALGKEGVALGRDAGGPWLIACSLFQWGIAAADQGDGGRAVPLATESLAPTREVGDPWLISHPLLGEAAYAAAWA